MYISSTSRKNKGFTLIELMVTVSIIAILTAIVVGNFTKARSKSRDAKRISDIAQMQLALEGYFDRCGQYPTVDLNNHPDLASTAGCPIAPDGSQMSLASFISVIPSDPTAGASYQYSTNANPPTDYVLMATLENNNAALTDDVDNRVSDNSPVFGVNCADPNYCVQPR